MDDQVQFMKGWFKDTTKNPPFEKLSFLRLDGDMYSSTIQVLDSLYHKVSSGGYVIVDDYALEGCSTAVEDFRARHGIDDPIHKIDWCGSYWRKS